MIRSEFDLRGKTLRNRLVLPPMATHTSTDQGEITEKTLAYYEARTEGQSIGMVITEHCFIAEEGRAGRDQIGACDEAKLPGLTLVAETIKKSGTFAAAQINHAGSAAQSGDIGCTPKGPSAIPNPGQKKELAAEIPEAMTEEDILKVKNDFVKAALLVKKAGFDAVEVHAAHGYLLNQFLSPLTNQRTDAYGGSRENRVRLVKEVLSAVREAVGEEFPVFLRLGGSDYLPGGNTPEDAAFYAQEAVKAGADLIDISGGMCRYINPNESKPGYFGDQSLAVKKAVNVPVILTGGVTEAAQAEGLLQEGKADLIGVGRAFYKDAKWADKQMK